MPASDLFVSSYDVEFRLYRTWIVVGKLPLFVKNVFNHPLPHMTEIVAYDLKGNDYHFRIGRLPLSAMTNCPYGWYSGAWYARAPARHRFQGIKTNSWWGILGDGTVFENCDYQPELLLPAFLSQPKYRPKGARFKGIVTRDVYISPNDRVMIRGIDRGEHVGEGMTLINPNTPQYLRGFLDNAGMKWREDQGVAEVVQEEPKQTLEAACAAFMDMTPIINPANGFLEAI